MAGAQFERKIEVQSLQRSLNKAHAFGYEHLWDDEKELAYSFRVGGVCSKYQNLLDWIEDHLENCSSIIEYQYLMKQIQLVRKSIVMWEIAGVEGNPMDFRLNTVNMILLYLLGKFKNDDHKNSGIQIIVNVLNGQRKILGDQIKISKEVSQPVSSVETTDVDDHMKKLENLAKSPKNWGFMNGTILATYFPQNQDFN